MQEVRNIRNPILALAVAALSAACGAPAPQDPYCSTAPLPGGGERKAGQGALQVEGATSDYFYVLDPAGKSVNHQSLGKTLALDPGKYQLKVNNSTHPVAVERDKLTRCATGALLASGTTSEYWYVLDATGKALQHNTLEKSLAFLPGSYAVKVNNTQAKADIVAGQVTELKTGMLLVKGLTQEYFYVSDAVGKQLNHQTLNKALAFFPGNYRVQVNKSERSIEIAAAQTVEVQTGSLMVERTGSDYYYVSDKTGNALNHNAVNKALSFFPAEYNVKLGQNTRSASVEAGQATLVKF